MIYNNNPIQIKHTLAILFRAIVCDVLGLYEPDSKLSRLNALLKDELVRGCHVYQLPSNWQKCKFYF